MQPEIPCRTAFGRGFVSTVRRKCPAMALFVVVVAFCLLVSGCAVRKSSDLDGQKTAISFDGSRIAYGVRGDGEPAVVFIHGWLCNRGMWAHQVDYFSRRYTVAWLDLAGHGDSTAGRGEYGVAAFGRDVQAVVEKMPQGDVVLVGHSLGGNVAVEAARLLGDRVVAIVAVDTFHTPLSHVPAEKKLQFVEWLKKDYPAALAATVESMFPPDADPRLVASTHEAMRIPDRHVGINALHALILWNEHEAPAALRDFSNKLCNINAGEPGGGPAAEGVTLIPGAGHFVAQAKPEAFNAALEAIIEGCLTD